MDGVKSHKKWRCPECGDKYIGPIPMLSVTCRNKKKHGLKAVAMKPEAE